MSIAPEIVCPQTPPWDLHSLDALASTWANSARITLRENLYGRQPLWGTEVRVGWSGEHFHGLFICGTLAYGWVAAFQIPFASLGDCHPGRSPLWRVNFTRIDRPQEEPCELSAWSPTLMKTFHVARRFGVLRFQPELHIRPR